jgi:hypothetical protein
MPYSNVLVLGGHVREQSWDIRGQSDRRRHQNPRALMHPSTNLTWQVRASGGVCKASTHTVRG